MCTIVYLLLGIITRFFFFVQIGELTFSPLVRRHSLCDVYYCTGLLFAQVAFAHKAKGEKTRADVKGRIKSNQIECNLSRQEGAASHIFSKVACSYTDATLAGISNQKI